MALLDIFRKRTDVFDDIEKEIRTKAEDIVRNMTPQLFSNNFNDGDMPKILNKSLWVLRSDNKKTIFNKLVEKRKTSKILKTPPATKKNLKYIRSDYNYARIDKFHTKESYFSRSIDRQIETMLRNGYDIISNDKKNLKIVKSELNIMQYGLKTPLDQTIAMMAENLKKYGFYFIQKYRKSVDDPNTKGKSKEKLLRIHKLRILKPHNMIIAINKDSDITAISEGYLQYAPDSNKTKSGYTGIDSKDLAFGTMFDHGDSFFPRPPCYPMFDDILTLRSIEETIELLCIQFGSPLLHAKVGTDDNPGNDPEVLRVHNNLVQMAPNGMITTNHRVKIDVINIQKGIANLIPYVEYFKNRVLSGSGSSPIAVGEGNTANRNTAESIDDALSDHCTYLATIIENTFNHNIIPDILIQAGKDYDTIYDDNGDPSVKLVFNEMRLDKKIARENHVMGQWNNHLITHPEARKLMRFSPLDVSQLKELRSKMIDEEAANNKQANLTKNQSQPSNQHGTKSAPGSKKN